MMNNFIVNSIFLFLLNSFEAFGDNDCTKNLGLSNSMKTIQDADIVSSINQNDATKARLNNPSGAWCFSLMQDNDVVSLTVNLKQARFITGVLTQGPPTSVLPASYFATANMEIDYSDDGSKWTSCCPDSNPRQFLTTDDGQSSDKIQIHSFGEKVGLIRTQFIRFKFKVNLILLASNPESVCFRFEIIGCPTDFTPNINITTNTNPTGFIDLTWSLPKIKIFSSTPSATPIEQEVTADSYKITIGNAASTNNATEVKTMAARYSMTLPQWGAGYKFVIVCNIQGQLLQCGAIDVQGILESEVKRGQIVTSGPTNTTAHAVGDTNVVLRWSYSDVGWVPLRYSVGLAGISGSQEISRSATSVKFSGLSPSLTYVVQFKPIFPGFTDPPLVLNATLNFINIASRKSQLVKAEVANNYGNFVAFMGAQNFKMTPIWSGRMRISWQPAVAYMLDSSESNSIAIQLANYTVSLLEMANKTTTRTAAVSSLGYEFRGIKIDTNYTSTLQCSLDGSSFVDCGRTAVRTRSPTAVIGTKNSSIFDLKPAKLSWGSAEAICQQENGHLVSLSAADKENLLKSTLPANISEFWIGASVCVNRTMTTIWTDGSPFAYFPLHSQTGLSRSECCLKVQRSSDGQFGWYAEQCGFPNFALCESTAEALISDFTNITWTKNPNITIMWNTTGTNWEPSSVRAQFCRAEDLKPSAPFVPPSQMKACLNLTTTTANYMNVTGLEDFVRYDVKVHGIVKGVVTAGPVWQMKLTTDPIKPIYQYITPEGITTLTWASLVHQGKGEVAVKVSYRMETQDTFQIVTGTAAVTKLGQLKYGANYTAIISEDGGNNETFSFKAMPMCTTPEYQSGKTCFWVRQRMALYTDTFAMCRERSGGGLAVLYNNAEEQLAANLSARLKQDLWIVERTLRKKRDLEIVELEDDTSDFEVIGPSSDNSCWYIGASSAQRQQVADCKSTRKFPLCFRSVAARTGMPIRQSGELNSFDIQRYPKAAKIAWPWESSSWLARFNVSLTKIVPVNGSSGAFKFASYTRMRRSVDSGLADAELIGAQVISRQFSQPPVVIEGLDEGFAYSADISADFGGPGKEFSGSFTVPGEVNVVNLSTNKTMEIIWMLVNGFMVALTAIGIMAFLASGTFFLDAIFQMGMLLSLLVAHLVLIIKPPYQFLGTCQPLAHLLHFLFICACTNLAAEAGIVTLRFRYPTTIKSLKIQALMCILTWSIPAVLTLIMAGVKRSPELVDPLIPICWLYLDGNSFYFWWSVLPIYICLAFVLGCTIFSYSNIAKTNNEQTRKQSEWMNSLATQFDGTERHQTYAITRWSLSIIAIFLGITWALGVSTIHFYNSNGTRVAFLIFALCLGAAILVFRVGQDRHVRRGLAKNCCNIQPSVPFMDGNKVRPMASKNDPFMTKSSRIGLKRLTESAYPDEYATRPTKLPANIPVTNPMPNFMSDPGPNEYVLMRKSYNFN